MATPICFKCGKALEMLPRGSVTDPSLDMWMGSFCTACKKVYCWECVKKFESPVICPGCGEIALMPTDYPLLKQHGVFA